MKSQCFHTQGARYNKCSVTGDSVLRNCEQRRRGSATHLCRLICVFDVRSRDCTPLFCTRHERALVGCTGRTDSLCLTWSTAQKTGFPVTGLLFCQYMYFSILVLTDQNTQEFTTDTNPHTTNTKTVLNELSHE